ncbi:MAG: IS630 family transposase [Microlunatus sp.]
MIDVEADEKSVLLRWKKRSDTLTLIRLKAEAILYASRGVGIEIIADMVDRSEKTVQGWLSEWRTERLCSVVTGHAGNQNAAKLTREQKHELEEVLAAPPSAAGVSAELWDVPALADVVKTRFDVEYASDSSYQLLMRFLGMSFKLPDPFDKRRDETAIAARMAEITAQVSSLLAEGYEVYTVDEVRVEHESETRRMWLPRGQRTKLSVDRKKTAQSFFGALSLTSKQVKIYPIEGRQNAEQIILMMGRLQRETSTNKIAVVLDNAGFHHAKDLTTLFDGGQALDRITPIYLPPYAPDHNPTEHVWNAAKGHIANLQRDNPEETFRAFTTYVRNREFDYDFEHLPIAKSDTDFD